MDKPTVTDRGKSGSGTTNQPETECSEYGQRHAAPDTPPENLQDMVQHTGRMDGLVDAEKLTEWWICNMN
jgi:hypothetical protein